MEYGGPVEVWLQVDAVYGSSQLNFTYTLVNKTATRLVEAHWVNFFPAVDGSVGDWVLDKVCIRKAVILWSLLSIAACVRVAGFVH